MSNKKEKAEHVHITLYPRQKAKLARIQELTGVTASKQIQRLIDAVEETVAGGE